MADAKKILIVDDDSLISRMYQERFSRDGFEVVLAFDGEDGVEKAKKEKPDFILLDIMMPKMNGYETLKILKKEAGTKSIPVMILSSIGGDPALVKKAKQLGIVDMVVKGETPAKEIVEKVRAVLGKR